MATTDYGVTSADVLAKLPVDASAIPATGGRLSLADLDAMIAQASGIVTGWVQRAGMAEATLTDDARAALAAAIEAHVSMAALLKLGHGEQGSKYQAMRRRYEAEERKWATSPQMVSGAPLVAESNVDSDATPSPYRRASFTGW